MTIDENNNTPINVDKENERANVVFENIYKLLNNAHRIARPLAESRDVRNTIENYDRDKAIALIATNIQKYIKTINVLSCITGRYVVNDPHFYDDKADAIILCDLKYIRNVIYFDEIKNAGLEKLLESGLKKLDILK